MYTIGLQSIVFIFPLMLLTLEKFRSPISSLFFGSGETSWLSGELSLQQTWYLLQLREYEEIDALQVACERTFLLFDFRSIKDLLEMGKQSTLSVKAAHIVTPSYMNGTDSWKMERIKQVVSGHKRVAGKEFPVEVLETADGSKYDCFDGLPFKAKLIGAKLKFDLSGSPNKEARAS
uniref:Uncharacterized protein n=1 Tax=Curvibacter symbiont subsp. Hydra magnipapillata TaxID=667019 RepID=C9Y8V3_CURXX|nr:hypothetical protein Csp_A05540 [Curvibacter putative symbiont of Hydra magnipapillata]